MNTNDVEWSTAACRENNVDPETFFPTGREDQWDTALVALAKAYCNRCQIRVQCLAWANSSGQANGIWGGQTPQERAKAKRDAVRDAVRERRDAEQRTLLGDLLRERAGDPDALLKEMVHPPMLIAGWAE